MTLKEKVIEVLRQECPIMVGDAMVGVYQMCEEEAEAIYELLRESGLLVSGELEYGEFDPVTKHYGITRESTFGADVYCVFNVEEPEKDADHVCFGSTDRARAERECSYLEAMNYGGGFNG